MREALPGLDRGADPVRHGPAAAPGSRPLGGPGGRRSSPAISPPARRWRGSPWATPSPTRPSRRWPTGPCSGGRRRMVTQVPGIMAFQALAARTGTVIADERTRITIRTALDGDDLDADLRDPATTVVVYKGGRRLPELAGRPAAAGRSLPGPTGRGRRAARHARRAHRSARRMLAAGRSGLVSRPTVIVPGRPTGPRVAPMISFVGAGPGAAGPDHPARRPAPGRRRGGGLGVVARSRGPARSTAGPAPTCTTRPP